MGNSASGCHTGVPGHVPADGGGGSAWDGLMPEHGDVHHIRMQPPRSPGQASSSASHYTAEIMRGAELFSKPSGK